MEGLEKHLTAEQFLNIVGQNMYHNNDDFSIVYTISEVREAIRLSKIEQLEEAVNKLKAEINEYTSGRNLILKEAIQILTNQINELKNGK